MSKEIRVRLTVDRDGLQAYPRAANPQGGRRVMCPWWRKKVFGVDYPEPGQYLLTFRLERVPEKKKARAK